MGILVGCAKRNGLSGLILALLLITLMGCGAKSTGTVSGKVTFEGKPLVCGTVSIYASDKKAWNGVIDKEGNYTVENVAVGEARFGVTSPNPNLEFDWTMGRRGKSRGPNKSEKNPEVLEQWFPIPLGYADPEQSGLIFTLQEGTNTHDIALTTKAPPKVDEP